MITHIVRAHLLAEDDEWIKDYLQKNILTRAANALALCQVESGLTFADMAQETKGISKETVATVVRDYDGNYSLALYIDLALAVGQVPFIQLMDLDQVKADIAKTALVGQNIFQQWDEQKTEPNKEQEAERIADFPLIPVRRGNLEARRGVRNQQESYEILEWAEDDVHCWTIAYVERGPEHKPQAHFVQDRPLSDQVSWSDFGFLLRLCYNAFH